MLLFRALNKYDIVSNPINNGLASKKMIQDMVKLHYESINDTTYLNLCDEDKDRFINDHMIDYLIEYRYKLEKLYKKRNKFYKNVMDELLDNKNPAGYIMFVKFLSSLQTHLRCGSKLDTNWISTSKSLETVLKYYENQDIHGVALIESNTNGIIDSERILTVDLSSEESIKKNNFLCNKINSSDIELLSMLTSNFSWIVDDFKRDFFVPTSDKAVSFNYSRASKEVCIYDYIPSEHIVGIIEALQMDLIRKKVFNEKFYMLDKSVQKEELKKLKKEILKIIKKMSDLYLLHVYNELYINNKNINSLITFTNSKQEVIKRRNKILNIATSIPNVQIKR